MWMRNVSYRFRYLNSWSPGGGAVCDDYGLFRLWSLAGGSTSLVTVLRVHSLTTPLAYSFGFLYD